MCQMPPIPCNLNDEKPQRLTTHLRRDAVSTQLVKDLIYNLQSYLYYYDCYAAEQEWTYLRDVNRFEQRLRDLLPRALEWVKQDGN